jgi:ATP-binding cassette subfamily C (CFTR/MRP) protein 1
MVFISVSSGYAALSFPFVAIVLYLIQRFYLRTSKQMRIMDLESKAPLYAHFTESTAGIATIRAFDWTEASTLRNEEFLDYSQKPFYLLFAIQRWLALVLDLVVAGVAVLIMGIAVRLHETLSPGWLGVALVNIITLSEELNNFIVSWTQTEAAMGSIARIKAFSETVRPLSSPADESEPPKHWPTAGVLEYDNVSCSGDDREQLILEGISLSINAGERIGICGRTGSGKSTLIGLLFRLMDPSKGRVLIDSLGLVSLDPEALRSRVAGAAQDACLIPGTIRDNLMSTKTDDELIGTLQHFSLWESIKSNGGLDSQLGEETFSHGQKQLFCFIRAYLFDSNILVLDEATSNMTEAMESLVIDAIQTHWSGRTVIAVAHRLRSIVGFDRVLVLRDGRILEFDSPARLLATESEFKKLYDLERMGGSPETGALEP